MLEQNQEVDEPSSKSGWVRVPFKLIIVEAKEAQKRRPVESEW